MKRCLLFIGEYYYPNGGFGDFVDSFDIERHAHDLGKWSTQHTDNGMWYEVVEIENVVPVPYKDWWWVR